MLLPLFSFFLFGVLFHCACLSWCVVLSLMRLIKSLSTQHYDICHKASSRRNENEEYALTESKIDNPPLPAWYMCILFSILPITTTWLCYNITKYALIKNTCSHYSAPLERIESQRWNQNRINIYCWLNILCGIDNTIFIFHTLIFQWEGKSGWRAHINRNLMVMNMTGEFRLLL